MRKGATSLILALVLLAGCRDRSQVSADTPLRFWNGFSGPDGQTMEKIVKAYNSENPKNAFKMQIIPWNTYYDKVTLGMAFGGAPDVFIMQVSRLPQYADAHALEPLSPMFKASGLESTDFVKTPFESGFWKGEQYGIPLDCWPLTMYYNRTLFREAGIDHPPTDLEEFLADAKKLTDPKKKQWGFAVAELHNNVLAFMNQRNAKVMDGATGEATLDSPEAIQGIDQLASFFEKERIAPPPEGSNAWDLFKTGRVGMVMQGIYMIADLQSQKGLEFAAAPVPKFGERRATWGGSHMLCIPKGLSPERKAKAWAFVKYLSDHSIQWAAAGQCPVRTNALNDPAFKTMEGQYQAARQLDYVQYEPMSPVSGQVGSFADAAWEGILMSGQPAGPTLKTAARRIKAVLERR